MGQRIRRRLSQLRASYEGEPWHGSSLRSILEGISDDEAFRRLSSGVHSIWELILHMTYWRRAAIDALSGASIAAFQPNTPEDWRSPQSADPEVWQQARSALHESQEELLQILESLSDEDLDRTVEGRDYPYDVIVLGILQHDVYHAGQISLLRRLFVEEAT